MKLGVKFGEIFRVLVFTGFGCPKRKFHAKKGVKKGASQTNFTLLGRGANKLSNCRSPSPGLNYTSPL